MEHWRRLAAIVVVSVLALFCIASVLPTFRILGRPQGTDGISWRVVRDASGDDVMTVHAIDALSPAEKAGIVTGLHLRADASLAERLAAKQPLLPGATRTLVLTDGATTRTFVLVEGPGEVFYPDDPFDRVFMAIRLPSSIVFGLAAVLLVARLPGKMSWGLALFLLTLRPDGIVNRYFGPLLTPEGWVALGALNRGLDVFGHVGIIVFALRFPTGTPKGRVATLLDRFAWPAAVAFTLAHLIDDHIAAIYWTHESLAFRAFEAGHWLINLLPFAAAVILISTLLRAHGVERRRLEWAVIALVIACLDEPVNTFASNLGTIEGGYVARIVGMSQLFVPLAVGYGVLRNRILDVGFVVNRAAVYTAVTGIFVGTLALLRLALGGYVHDNWAIAVQAVAALGLGLSTQKISKFADWLVDKYLFPDAHKTEQRFKRLEAGLKFTDNTDAIAAAIVDEPVDALRLASAAFFRKRDDGTFFRKRSSGWNDDQVQTFAADDPLPIYLSGDETHFDVRAMLGARQGFPNGHASPHHAYPLTVRRELAGFALYSEKADGAALDPDEEAMLDKLIAAAGEAYDPILRVKAVRKELGAS